MALDEGTTVNSNLGSLTNNLSGIDDILEDRRMDGCQSAVAWTLLLRVRLALPAGLRENATESANEHLWTAELLLQLANKTVVELVVGTKLRCWDVDNNSFLVSNLIFL